MSDDLEVRTKVAVAVWKYAGSVTNMPNFASLPPDIREHYLGLAGHAIAAYKNAMKEIPHG